MIEKVPCWVKLGEVPPTYWSHSGLVMIAKLLGHFLKFDEITTQFQPLKFTHVQIKLEYSAPRPNHVWVPIINSLGEEEKMKVDVEFSQFPYSCSLCKAFGHSLARCHENPNREAPPSKRPRKANESKGSAASKANVDINEENQG